MEVTAHRQVSHRSRAALTETPEHFSQPSGEAHSAEQKRENDFRVQPVIEGNAQEPSHDRRRGKNKRKLAVAGNL